MDMRLKLELALLYAISLAAGFSLFYPFFSIMLEKRDKRKKH